MRALARLANRFPWAVVGVAAAFATLAGMFGGPVAGLLSGGGFTVPGSESDRAAAQVQSATGALSDPVLILIRPGATVTSPAARVEVESVRTRVAADPDVKSVLGFYETGSQAFVSRSGDETYLAVQLRPSADAGAAATRIASSLRGDPDVEVGGSALIQSQVQSQVKHDLAMAELLAFPLLFLLSLWVFRGVIAALLPLMSGGIAILGAFLGLRLVILHTPISIFALNLVTGMGLGLAIDYSLFIISRFREELAAGVDVETAISRTVTTAGRTVLFSSLTVAVALASLAVFPELFLYSMAIGGVIVALMASAAALLVLPAVLRLLGPRVNSLAPRSWHRPQDLGRGGWYRLALVMLRRPALAAAGAAIFMVALGLPFLGIRFTSVDATVLPTSYSSRQVSDTVNRDFPSGSSRTLYVVMEAPASASSEVAAFTQRLGAIPEVSLVSYRPIGGSTWEIDVTPRHGLYSPQVASLVTQIRALGSAHPFLVGGVSANFVDLQASLAHGLPIAIAIVAGGAMLLLLLMTGSVLLPIKAVLMNLLTLSAAFGSLVLIFQRGNLEWLLRFTSQGALESTQPVLLFALVFGLSTDYGVFLLARIKEAKDGGASNSDAVAIGLGRTGRIVSAAALLFCVAIGAFATSQIVFIKELGVGTALGVLIDATVVRGVLVPSLMALLGDWNWWAPAALNRLQGRLNWEPTEPVRAS